VLQWIGNKTWGPIPVGWTLQVEGLFLSDYGGAGPCDRPAPAKNAPHRRDVFLLFRLHRLCRPHRMTKHLWGNGFLFAPFFGVGVIAAIISRLETDQHSMRLCGGLALSILLALCVTVLFFMLLPTPIPGYATRGTVTFSVVCGLFFLCTQVPGRTYEPQGGTRPAAGRAPFGRRYAGWGWASLATSDRSRCSTLTTSSGCCLYASRVHVQNLTIVLVITRRYFLD